MFKNIVLRYLPIRRRKLRFWLVAIGLFLVNINPVSFAAGIALLLVGSGLHLWSKGHLHQNRILTTSGPYRWVRNPFYLATALIDLGICLVVNRLELTLGYFALWVFIYAKTIRREERRLETLFGDEFLRYKKRVPCLIPWRLPLPATGTSPGFSWKNPNIAQGSEISRLLLIMSVVLLFFSLFEIRKEGIGFVSDVYGFELLALCGVVFLAWLSYGLKISLKSKKHLVPYWLSDEPARNLFIIALLIFLFLFQKLETELDVLFPIGGIITLAILAFTVFPGKHFIEKTRFRLLIEAIILVIVCFLGELPWCSLFVECYYSVLIIDAGKTKTCTERGTMWVMTRLIAIMIIGTNLMLLKEYISDGGAFKFLTG